MVSRGTTSTHIFTVPIDFTEATALYITYQQLGRTVLEKELSDCTVESDKITVHLTQADTVKFKEDMPVRIQIRVKMADGSAHKSAIIETTADELLKEGVI